MPPVFNFRGYCSRDPLDKAPVAMQIAEELIDGAKGPQSELDKLTTIFSTSDALKGLTSIGKKVEYEGK